VTMEYTGWLYDTSKPENKGNKCVSNLRGAIKQQSDSSFPDLILPLARATSLPRLVSVASLEV